MADPSTSVTEETRKKAEFAKQYIENMYSNKSKALNDRQHRCAAPTLRLAMLFLCKWMCRSPPVVSEGRAGAEVERQRSKPRHIQFSL
jgi:hypothetical protein